MSKNHDLSVAKQYGIARANSGGSFVASFDDNLLRLAKSSVCSLHDLVSSWSVGYSEEKARMAEIFEE